MFTPMSDTYRLQNTDSRLQTASTSNVRLQIADQPQTTDHRNIQRAECKMRTADRRPQTADHRPQTADPRLQNTNCRLYAVDCRLSAVYSQQNNVRHAHVHSVLDTSCAGMKTSFSDLGHNFCANLSTTTPLCS